MFKFGLTGFAVVLILSFNAAALAADAVIPKRRVVMQINENDEQIWKHALTLAENMQANSGGKDSIEIEIVAMSPGIRMLDKDGPFADRVSKAATNGILVRACGYTMSVVRWGNDKLAPGVKVVPFGALEIVDKQIAGWAYIKP